MNLIMKYICFLDISIALEYGTRLRIEAFNKWTTNYLIKGSNLSCNRLKNWANYWIILNRNSIFRSRQWELPALKNSSRANPRDLVCYIESGSSEPVCLLSLLHTLCKGYLSYLISLWCKRFLKTISSVWRTWTQADSCSARYRPCRIAYFSASYTAGNAQTNDNREKAQATRWNFMFWS